MIYLHPRPTHMKPIAKKIKSVRSENVLMEWNPSASLEDKLRIMSKLKISDNVNWLSFAFFFFFSFSKNEAEAQLTWKQNSIELR